MKIYCCGITTSGHAHAGHARTYITTDLIVRTMNNILNQKTHFVMNITDIDDKIINKAIETNTSWKEISKIYEKSFFDSMAKLNVQLPDVVIRVSEVMPEIVSYIQTIVDKGFAYVTMDGSIYFDTNAYANAGYVISDMVDTDDEEPYNSEITTTILEQKKNKKDFALWKGRTQDEVGFDVEFGYQNNKIYSKGRPGWHLECSCMIHETLGDHLDIHLGGIDLKFPHHHNEILQSNAFHHPLYQDPNKLWCDRFIHIGHLHIQGCKMSKSLKNFITIDEALQDITANQMRWMFMASRYSEPMEFDLEVISQAKSYDTTVENFFGMVINYPFSLMDVKTNEKERALLEELDKSQKKILEQLGLFDFHFVIRYILNLVSHVHSYINKGNPNQKHVHQIYHWIKKLLQDLGFDYENTSSGREKEVMRVLVDTRTQFRQLTRDKNISKETKQKIFEIIDAERDVKLKEIGITLKDTKESSFWN